MSQVRLGMCQNMETDILELIEEMILVRRVVRLVMNACTLGHPTRNPSSQYHITLHQSRDTSRERGEGDTRCLYVPRDKD
jgi:hypothetical protein